MKKIIFISVTFLCAIVTLHAQENISIKIAKVVKNDVTFLKVSITNNNADRIHIYNTAEYLKNANRFERTPSTYIKIIGNSVSKTIESTPLILPGMISHTGQNKQPLIGLKAGETIEGELQLFGSIPHPLIAFAKIEEAKIKDVKAELHLTYYYYGDKKNRDIIVNSNILTLSWELIEDPLPLIPFVPSPNEGNGNGNDNGLKKNFEDQRLIDDPIR